jgi:hypothetical protein
MLDTCIYYMILEQSKFMRIGERTFFRYSESNVTVHKIHELMCTLGHVL